MSSVIWAGPFEDKFDNEICCIGECGKGYTELCGCTLARPFIELAIAQKLQIAMGRIADDLEELASDIRGQHINDLDAMDAIRWQAKHARKALKEFERTE